MATAADTYKKLDIGLQRARKKYAELKKKLDNHVFANSSEGARAKRKLKAVADRILILNKKIEKLQKKGIYDFSVLGGDGMIRDEDGSMGMLIEAFDTSDKDGKYKTILRESITNWSLDKLIRLNSVRTYMIERKEPAGLEIGDIVGIVALVFPPAGKLKIAIDVAKTLEKAFNTYLAAKNGPTPSLNEIHKAWEKAMDAIAKVNVAPIYKAFAAEFVANAKGSADEASFRKALQDFRLTHMPTASAVQKAFITRILKTVKDTDWNPFGEGTGKKAVAFMTMVTPSSSASHFGSPKGYLDDAPSDLMQGLKAVYGKNAKVVDLPIPIHVTVKTHMGAYTTVIQRKSKVAGNTSFKKTSGEDKMFEGFMKGKFYNSLKLGDLSSD